MNVKEIVKQYLQANEHDGLCNEDCGCGLDDFMPCGDNVCADLHHCEIAKKVIATAEHCDVDFNEFEIGDEIFVPVEVTKRKD